MMSPLTRLSFSHACSVRDSRPKKEVVDDCAIAGGKTLTT